jgi:CHAT domain-containing protein/predicted negative regulator of RcsB-dependent stress response
MMHRFCCYLSALLLLLAGTFGHSAEQTREVTVPPPRTIDDITRMLGHYKPDPALVARLQNTADAEAPATTDRTTLFDFYWQRGLAAEKIGRLNQTIDDLRKATEFGEKGSAKHVRMLRNLASAETVGGNLLNAVRTAEESWRQTPKNQLGQSLAAEQLLVVQYVLLGDFESAKKHLREAESSFTLLQRSQNWSIYGHSWSALVERARAEIFFSEGRYGEAEGAYRRALRNTEMHIQQAQALPSLPEDQQLVLESFQQYREGMERSLSRTLLAEGKIVEAEVYARQALKHSLERAGRGSTPVAQGLSLLAYIIAEQGRNQEAVKLAQEALHSYEMAGAAPESVFIAGARRALGAALVAQGKYAEAMTIFTERREALGKDANLLKKIGSGDLDWVLAMMRTGDQTGAERMAKSMLDYSVRLYGDKALRTATVRAFYAMTLAQRGEREDALKRFQLSVPVLLDQARNDSESENGTIKRQQRLVAILESYLKLLAESSQAGAYIVGANAEEAFRIADIARGSAVQRALTASATRANISDPQLAELARREQDAQRRINALSNLLTKLLSAPPEQQLPKVHEQMRQDIETLKKEREALKKQIAEQFPDYSELVDPKPATVGQVAKSLREGEVLLAYYFGEEHGFVWALKADGKVAFSRIALPRSELAKDVSALRKALDPGVSTIDEIPAFDVNAAHRLYLTLMHPLKPVWQGAKIILAVPHAELGQLPFAVLVTEAVTQPVNSKNAQPFATYRDVPWLMRQAAIAQLPSVTALASLRKQVSGDRDRQLKNFIGFGDPLFSKAQAKEANIQLASAKSVATRGGPLRLRSTPKTSGVDSAELALLPRLPDTGEEIREIGAVLNADPDRDIFLQNRAIEKTVMETNMSDRRVVMFATHGLVPGDLNGLTLPALALTTPDLADGNGDGLLTMDEILNLKLNADWVVLSACNTAAGEGSGSEAVSGLGRAFFYAGARALLVSNWPVETVAARKMMVDLFRRQVADPGLSKAEALRQSMIALSDSQVATDSKTGKVFHTYAHPLFWAPFVVVGD